MRVWHPIHGSSLKFIESIAKELAAELTVGVDKPQDIEGLLHASPKARAELTVLNLRLPKRSA